MPQKEGVTLELIGHLGGCTKQAVSLAKNPLRWLQSRVRRALSPSLGYEDNFFPQETLKQTALSGSQKLLKDAKDYLESLPLNSVKPVNKVGPGRPKTLLTPNALAAFLNVKSGETLYEVFRNFIRACYKDLLRLLDKEASQQPGLFRQALDALLDLAWLPFRPKDGCQKPPGEISILDAIKF